MATCRAIVDMFWLPRAGLRCRRLGTDRGIKHLDQRGRFGVFVTCTEIHIVSVVESDAAETDSPQCHVSRNLPVCYEVDTLNCALQIVCGNKL